MTRLWRQGINGIATGRQDIVISQPRLCHVLKWEQKRWWNAKGYVADRPHTATHVLCVTSISTILPFLFQMGECQTQTITAGLPETDSSDLEKETQKTQRISFASLADEDSPEDDVDTRRKKYRSKSVTFGQEVKSPPSKSRWRLQRSPTPYCKDDGDETHFKFGALSLEDETSGCEVNEASATGGDATPKDGSRADARCSTETPEETGNGNERELQSDTSRNTKTGCQGVPSSGVAFLRSKSSGDAQRRDKEEQPHKERRSKSVTFIEEVIDNENRKKLFRTPTPFSSDADYPVEAKQSADAKKEPTK